MLSEHPEGAACDRFCRCCELINEESGGELCVR